MDIAEWHNQPSFVFFQPSQSSAFVRYVKGEAGKEPTSSTSTPNMTTAAPEEITDSKSTMAEGPAFMPFSINALLAHQCRQQLQQQVLASQSQKPPLDSATGTFVTQVSPNPQTSGTAESDLRIQNPTSAAPRVLPSGAVIRPTRKRSQRERRPRTTFSADQTTQLEQEYQKTEYVSRSRRVKLAQILKLTEGQIKIW